MGPNHQIHGSVARVVGSCTNVVIISIRLYTNLLKKEYKDSRTSCFVGQGAGIAAHQSSAPLPEWGKKGDCTEMHK